MKYIATIFFISLLAFNTGIAPKANAQSNTAPNLRNALGKTQNVAAQAGLEKENLEALIGDVIFSVFSLIGIIFLVLMIYGGYLWMMARGNDEQVRKAQSLIQAAVIGLIIIVAAYAITNFVLTAILE